MYYHKGYLNVPNLKAIQQTIEERQLHYAQEDNEWIWLLLPSAPPLVFYHPSLFFIIVLVLILFVVIIIYHSPIVDIFHSSVFYQ